jgi:hypothetical protein
VLASGRKPAESDPHIARDLSYRTQRKFSCLTAHDSSGTSARTLVHKRLQQLVIYKRGYSQAVSTYKGIVNLMGHSLTLPQYIVGVNFFRIPYIVQFHIELALS